jgi:methionine-rich copper-binding protein CopC
MLLSITGMLAVAAPAFAHSRLVSSDPAEGANLDTGPTQVSLTFNEDMPPGFDAVVVIGPDGAAWQTGEVTTSGPTVSIAVAPLGPAGRYQVGYRVVSGDGHPVQGSTSFLLTKAGTGAPPTQPAATGTPVAGDERGTSSGGGNPIWPWIVGGIVVIGVGVVVALNVSRA